MGVHVWTYWKCSSCEGIIRGDSRTCPNCGRPIPSDVKYMMPDDPRVVRAIRDGTLLIQSEKTIVEESGAISEVVPEELVSDNPNWICDYCGFQNRYEAAFCESCGSPKTEAARDYFSVYPSETYGTPPDLPEDPWQALIPPPYKPFSERVLDWFKLNKKIIAAMCGSVLGLIIAIWFLIWLFTPVMRTATIRDFAWERSIDVQEYTLFHESDWSLPKGAVLTGTREEIHHYNQVFDHYETYTREVPYEELDDYDIEYEDLGNGQAERIEVPRYITKYRTETYEEAVYVDVPEYWTKYYYDIGRWVTVGSLKTEAHDHTPYWHEIDLPESISDPHYGDRILGLRQETFYVYLYDENEEVHCRACDYFKWCDLQEGDQIFYESFRFDKDPINFIGI